MRVLVSVRTGCKEANIKETWLIRNEIWFLFLIKVSERFNLIIQ